MRRIWSFLKRRDGYTFSLYFSFAYVTIGAVILLILMWFAGAGAAYNGLQTAATSAAGNRRTPSIPPSSAQSAATPLTIMILCKL